MQHNTQHLLLPSPGPGMQHLAKKIVRVFKTKELQYSSSAGYEFRLYFKKEYLSPLPDILITYITSTTLAVSNPSPQTAHSQRGTLLSLSNNS